MRKNLLFASAGVLLFLIVAGCASTAIEKNPELRRAAANVQILDQQQAKGALYTMLGEVEGISCARQAGSTPSPYNARENLKVNAAKMGGNAVINVACQEGGVSSSHNCWRTITCRGDAVRLTN
jgi:hypothetical protein